jgi:hypothetical protein
MDSDDELDIRLFSKKRKKHVPFKGTSIKAHTILRPSRKPKLVQMGYDSDDDFPALRSAARPSNKIVAAASAVKSAAITAKASTGSVFSKLNNLAVSAATRLSDVKIV